MGLQWIYPKFRLGATRNPEQANVPHGRRETFSRGFTLVELLIAIAIVATLAGIAMPVYKEHVNKTRIARAIAEVRTIERAIKVYEAENDMLPDSLNEVEGGNIPDPWGNPYVYLQVAGTPQGHLRKDRFLVPVNTDFDLYSMGEDGDSKAPFTAQASRDDIVRASNGAYVGLASEF